MAKRGAQFTGAQSYYDELANLATLGQPASAFGITAGCFAFDIQIHAVYPQVNGPEDKYVQVLGGVYSVPGQHHQTELKIMWTNTSGLRGGSKSNHWEPNHFVPLILAKEVSVQRVDSTNSTKELSAQRVDSINSTSDQEQPNFTVPQSLYTYEVTTQCARQTPLQMVQTDEENYLEKIQRLAIPIDGPQPLTRIFNLLSLKDPELLKKAPIGHFLNVAFLVDYTSNIQRLHEGCNQLHWDPQGAFKRPSTTSSYYTMVDGSLIFLGLNKNKLKTISPMPMEEDLFVLRKVTHISKVELFKKRTCYFVKAPSEYADLVGRAFVEYIGASSSGPQVHGNSKTKETPYMRQDPDLMNKARTLCQNMIPSKVYAKLSQTDDFTERLRDNKTAENLRYNLKSENGEVIEKFKTLADEVKKLFDMVGDGFCQVMWMTSSREPAMICYTREQIIEMAAICSDESFIPMITSFDKTFNMCAGFISAITYQQPNLVRNGKSI
jgi:hypothetical protein